MNELAETVIVQTAWTNNNIHWKLTSLTVCPCFRDIFLRLSCLEGRPYSSGYHPRSLSHSWWMTVELLTCVCTYVVWEKSRGRVAAVGRRGERRLSNAGLLPCRHPHFRRNRSEKPCAVVSMPCHAMPHSLACIYAHATKPDTTTNRYNFWGYISFFFRHLSNNCPPLGILGCGCMNVLRALGRGNV